MSWLEAALCPASQPLVFIDLDAQHVSESQTNPDIPELTNNISTIIYVQ